jgi:hypothetical protein
MSSLIDIIRLFISQALIRVSSSVIINRLQTTLTNVLQLLKLPANLLPPITTDPITTNPTPSNPYKANHRGILLLGESGDGRTMMIKNFINYKSALDPSTFVYDLVDDVNKSITEYLFKQSIETTTQNYHLINMTDGVANNSSYFTNAEYIMLSFKMNFTLNDSLSQMEEYIPKRKSIGLKSDAEFKKSTWTSNLNATKNNWLSNAILFSGKKLIIVVNLFKLKIPNQGLEYLINYDTNTETITITDKLYPEPTLTINKKIRSYNDDPNNQRWDNLTYLTPYNELACKNTSFMTCVNEFKEFAKGITSATEVSLAFIIPCTSHFILPDESAGTIYTKHVGGIAGPFDCLSKPFTIDKYTS